MKINLIIIRKKIPFQRVLRLNLIARKSRSKIFPSQRSQKVMRLMTVWKLLSKPWEIEIFCIRKWMLMNLTLVHTSISMFNHKINNKKPMAIMRLSIMEFILEKIFQFQHLEVKAFEQTEFRSCVRFLARKFIEKLN